MDTSVLDVRGGVELRLVSVSDAPAIYACARRNLERLRPWFFWANPELDLAEIERRLQELAKQPDPRRDYEYGLWSGGEYAGSAGLYKIDFENRIARIGYWLDGAFEGHGLMTQSVRALVDTAFSRLKLNRIEIRCAPENLASRAVPGRLGFTREGVHREALALHGGFQDLVMYSMLARDWLL